MKILAIEQSTTTSSLALLENADIIKESTWGEIGIKKQRLFSEIPVVLGKEDIDSIDAFAVGTGPGIFSGLRISLSAANGIALPSKKPVIGITSGESLAADIFERTKSDKITIIGDARRNRLWVAQFENNNGSLTMTKSYSLIEWDELTPMLQEGSTLATPDWDRIGKKLEQDIPSHINMLKKKHVPSAGFAGKIAFQKLDSGQTIEPPQIIYMHPPVFVEPKFS